MHDAAVLRRSGRLRLRPHGLAMLALACAAVGGALSMARANVVQTGHVKAELASQTTAATPGRPLYVALHQTIAPGWHTYWRNPGDAGQPTTLDWTLPQGWSAGPIIWGAPERFLAGPIMNYVYTGAVDLPVRISVPAFARPGQTVSLKAAANWLVCKDVCIPESAKLSLDLPVAAGPAPINPNGGDSIARAVADAPKPGGLSARFQADAGTVKLFVAGAALKELDTAHAYFFPYDAMALEQASPQRVARGASGLTLVLPAGYGFSHGKPPAKLEGVLSLGGKAFEVSASPGTPPPGAAGLAAPVESTPPPETAAPLGETPPSSAAPPPASRDGLGLAAALGLAFVGGLVLNLMPCVFPVLSIKAAALARHLESPARARGEGIAFLLGVVGSFVALAAMLILARAAGQAVGWGFQLQSPGVVAVLALIMLAAGLNLSGVFEAGLSLQGVGAETAARHQGWIGSALTGVLAVVVAAPCTAPFMAPAIGWALVQPAGVALAVFVALGLGLAAPFTAISFTPGLFGRLPRPGAWMDGLRKVLAFPMYGAAAWLAWVYAEQAGIEGLPRLFAAALAAAFAAFCWGVAQRARRPLTPRVVSVASIAAAIAVVAGAAAA
ncbi:protein-disulfide reductase DsbD domain-containing protein, partial [Caulobacter sp. S45]|uniref:protein-disulfide reductase DsbD domain-containing protein n=1 Tax=Caulobacter sp. S45 TaxID=1641861 RepID=UPI0015772CB1